MDQREEDALPSPRHSRAARLPEAGGRGPLRRASAGARAAADTPLRPQPLRHHARPSPSLGSARKKQVLKAKPEAALAFPPRRQP